MTEQRRGRRLTLHQFVGLYCDREPIPACGMKHSLLFNLKETLLYFTIHENKPVLCLTLLHFSY